MKIAVMSSLVLTIILLCFGTVIYLTVYNRVVNIHEKQLNTQAQSVAQQYASQVSDVGQIGPEFITWLNHYNTYHQKIYVYGSDRKPIASAGDLTVTPFVPDFSNQPAVHTIHVGNTALIYAVRPVQSDEIPGRILGYVAYVTDFSDINGYMNLLLIVLIGGSIGAVLLAGFGGYMIATAALRPIHRLIDVVERIEENHLDGRAEDIGGNDEVGRLTRTFNNMLSRVQKSFEQQRRFVADASHEIRTPLTTIIGYTDLLGRWGKSDPKIVETAISSIRNESIRLSKLADDLLFLAGLEAKRNVAVGAADVDSVIKDVTAGLSLLYPSTTVIFDLCAHTTALITPDHFRQISTNIIGNAFKYSPAGGSISLRTFLEGNHIVVQVEDSGCGISEAELPHVFDRFYRVDKSREREQGGNGLGLAIVQELVHTHRGSVSIHSVEDEGTTVTVTLLRAT